MLGRKSCDRSWGLGWCMWRTDALLYYMGVHVVQEEGRFFFGGGWLFSIFTMGNAIGSSTVKFFRFVCENLTTFPFGKRIIGKLDSRAFWCCIRFQHQRRGLWHISKKVTIVLPKLKCKQETVAARAAIRAAAAADGHLHIYECTLRRSAASPTARTVRLDAARSQIIWAHLLVLVLLVLILLSSNKL